MKKYVFAIVLFVAFVEVSGQSSLIPLFGNTKLSAFTKIEADDNNHLYIAGYFSGSVSVGSQTYSSNNGRNFICRTDASGQVVWFIQSAATVIDIQYNKPEILVLWSYNASASVLDYSATSAKDNVFLMSLSPEGKKNWVVASECNDDNVYADAIDIDASGNIYLLGEYANTVTFGSKKLTKTDYRNAYLLKMNKSGAVQWLSQMSGGDSFITGVWTQALTVMDENHIYVGGSIAGNCTFGSKKISSKIYHFSDGDLYSGVAFVATYNSSGVCTEVKQCISEADITQMDCDQSGNLIIGGYFKGNVSEEDFATSYFGSTAVKATIDPVLSGPSEDAFVAKFTPEGSLIWVTHSAGSSTDRLMSMVIASDGSVYAGGFFFRDMAFVGVDKRSEKHDVSDAANAASSIGDIFMLKLSAEGNLEWFTTGGGAGSDDARSMVMLSDQLIVAGFMTGSVMFDNVTATMSCEKQNAVLIKR